MAKKETKSNQTVNAAQQSKKKAKKRKHMSKESDEEVASKSLIVESVEDDKFVDSNPGKAIKRKNKEKDIIKEKRSKQTAGNDDGSNTNAHIDDEMEEPTLEELFESEKPENLNAIVTVRQKKKQKHQLRLESIKDQTVSKERVRNEEYLRKWKHGRVEWKFEKLRQISIQQTVFEEEKISAEMWPVALEYLSGSKGAAKAQIIKLAEQCIDELDKQCAEQNSEEERKLVIDSTRYQRARDLLQSFD